MPEQPKKSSPNAESAEEAERRKREWMRACEESPFGQNGGLILDWYDDDGRPKRWVRGLRRNERGVVVEKLDPPGVLQDAVFETLATGRDKEMVEKLYGPGSGQNAELIGHNPSSDVYEEAEIWMDEYRPDDGRGATPSG